MIGTPGPRLADGAEGRRTDIVGWLARSRHGGVTTIDGATTTWRPWSQVLADAEEVAAHLARAGLGPGLRVGVRAPNRYEWLVLDVALAIVGAVVVGVPDDAFRAMTNRQLAERFGLAMVFVGPEGAAGAEGPTVGSLADLLRCPPVQVAARPAPTADGGDPDVVAVTFSSGTSGRAKAVPVRWTAQRALIEAQQEAHPLRPSDRIMIALPLATIQQRFLCYLAMRCDCSVVLTTVARLLPGLQIARPTVLLGPPLLFERGERWYRNIPGRRRRSLDAVAALGTLLPRRSWRLRWRRRVYRGLHDLYGGEMRLMLVGSAPVRVEMLEVFARCGAEMFQIYGMAESGFIAWNRPGANRIGSVGRAVHPGSVSIGPDGSILVRHPWHLSPGYEGEDPSVVAAVFRGGDEIATGDIGRLDDDGYLYLEGRNGNVIVTSGGRKLQIEDLEEELARAAGVEQVVLYPTDEGAGPLTAAVWYRGDRSSVRAAVGRQVAHVNRGLRGPVPITHIALVEGGLAPDSPLVNRGLKIDRDAVRTATAARAEPLDTGRR